MGDLLPFIAIGLVTGSVYGLAAMGLVLTYKTSGVFNFAQGGVSALAAGGYYELVVKHGISWPIAAVITVVGGGLIFGLIFEFAARLVAVAVSSMKIVAMVGVLISVSGIFVLRFGSNAQFVPHFLPQKSLEISSAFVSYEQIIIIAIGLAAAVLLPLYLRVSRSGRHMRAIVDDPDLLALSGASAVAVRRRAWILSCAFASLAGILVAPSVGLDGTTLTLLVVQGFAAAAIGRFTSLPGTYVGALLIGVMASVSTKYASENTYLSGLALSFPFIVLFLVLLFAKRESLVEAGLRLQRRRSSYSESPLRLRSMKIAPVAALAILAPFFVNAHLGVWTIAVIYVALLLSLSLLVKTSNQVSLCHLSFAAIGAVAFHAMLDHSVPWTVALVIAGLITVPIGAFIAIPAIRLSGLFLALATLGFGILLQQEFFRTPLMFGTGTGSIPMPRPSFATSDRGYYYVVVVVVALCYLIVRAVERGPLGKLLRARGDSPAALASLGANTNLGPLLAFCISSFVAGVAGALVGPVFGVIGTGNFQTYPGSLLLVALFVLGSRDRRVGTLGACVIAAASLILIPDYITNGTVLNWLNVGFGLFAVEAAYYSTRRAPRPKAEGTATSEQAARAGVGTSFGTSLSKTEARSGNA